MTISWPAAAMCGHVWPYGGNMTHSLTKKREDKMLALFKNASNTNRNEIWHTLVLFFAVHEFFILFKNSSIQFGPLQNINIINQTYKQIHEYLRNTHILVLIFLKHFSIIKSSNFIFLPLWMNIATYYFWFQEKLICWPKTGTIYLSEIWVLPVGVPYAPRNSWVMSGVGPE